MTMENTQSKCLVCFCSLHTERTKYSEEFATVFDTLCRILKLDLIKPMQWNFEQDHIPFCEFCSTAVEKLSGLYHQIESLQHQMTTIIDRIKHEVLTSGCDSNTANDRGNDFRRLVVGNSPEENGVVKTEVTSLNVNPMTEMESHLSRHNRIDLPEEIIESSEFEDACIEIEPLLTVKRENDSTIDCIIETFPQDNLENLMNSSFQAPNGRATSVQELDSEPDEIKTELHSCQFCEKTFHEKLLLELHLKQHLDENNINCETCNATFLSRNDLILHQKQIHRNQLPTNSEIVNTEGKLILKLIRIDLTGVKYDNRNLCEVCEKGGASSEQFNSLHRLTCYKRIHTGDKKFKCDYCDKRFRQRWNLMAHRRSHTGERPYKCDVCLKSCAVSGNLVSHKRIHTGEKPFKCDVCNKSFAQQTSLRVHKIIHTGDRPYKCDVCNKSFVQRISLKVHKIIHAGERPYKCDVCNKSFGTSGVLNTHKRIHTGEKPYKCTVCNKSFSRPHALKMHNRIHTGDRPYQCDICNKSFDSSVTLAEHKSKPTGEKPCKYEVCNKSFSQSPR